MKRALLLLALMACGGDSPKETPAPADNTPQGETSTALAGEFTGVYRVVEGEIPLNEEFTVELWLFEDEAMTQPLADGDVSIDCRMPHHRHGMLADVELVHQGEGRYLAEGMMCHMLGEWELYVDRQSGPLTERVQWNFRLQ